jgi:hypothetical protein
MLPEQGAVRSTRPTDPEVSDLHCLPALATAFTLAPVPEATLRALAGHRRVSNLLPPDAGTMGKC